MSYQFRILGVLATMFKSLAVLQLLAGVFALVFLARSGEVAAGLLALAGGMTSALFTFSAGSIIDLAIACEGHLRTIAHDNSPWATTSS